MKEKFVLYGHPIIPISRIIEVFKIIIYSGCYIGVQQKEQEEGNTAPLWSDWDKLHWVWESSEWTVLDLKTPRQFEHGLYRWLWRSATCLGRITVKQCYQAPLIFYTMDVIELLEALES